MEPRTKSEQPEQQRRTVAIIPAYNEERFIGSVVLKARRYVSVVLVVDDGSTDATGEVAEAAGAIVLRHERNLGKGVALNTGFHKAMELNPEAIVTLDGDGQHPAEEIPLVLAPILAGEADIVIGSRYLERRSCVPLHRIWGHRAFTFLTNLMSGVHVTDSQSGFRAFSPRAVRLITFRSHGFSVESEMQFLAHEHKLKMIEVPVTINYKDKPKRPVVSHGLAVLNGILQLVGQYRPLFFFGVPGAVLLLMGLTCEALVVGVYHSSQRLLIEYALIGIVLFIFGSLSLFTGIILHSVRGLLLSLLRDRDR